MSTGLRVPGGLCLSKRSRKGYEKVQQALKATIGDKEGVIKYPENYEAAHGALSALRTQLTADLLSRRGAPFRLG